MNVPNKLTILRFILSPVFMAVMMIDFPGHFLAALIVFVTASITDWLDGYLARRDNQITNFGKFLDPIADKMLTTAAFLGFTFMNIGYGIVLITFIVLLREFVVMSVRLVAVDNGKVIAANYWGKLKTVTQMVAISTTLAFEYFLSIEGLVSVSLQSTLELVYTVLLWISAVLTLIAGATYIIDNKDFINFNK